MFGAIGRLLAIWASEAVYRKLGLSPSGLPRAPLPKTTPYRNTRAESDGPGIR
jgi:hypothetical protein